MWKYNFSNYKKQLESMEGPSLVGELPKVKGLPKQSMVMAEQRETVDKKQLLKYSSKVTWLTLLYTSATH